MTSRSTTGPRFDVVRFVFAAFLVMTALRIQPAAAQAPSHVDVVALMVEFQPDTTRFTTGDGTFGGVLFEGVEAPLIDPLPHNAEYFEAHMAFLANYVSRVSDARTTVRPHVLPGTVRLSKPMGAYSPTGVDADSDEELAKLAAMVREAWTLADSQGIRLPGGLDPSSTAFVIFHAGVGRDIELVGTTLDKTPEDIPSLFFDEDALDRLGAGDIVLDGFPVRSTMVLPRTESRLGVDVLTSEPFLIELSINGLLAASFFNFLGVPDLFNTETGDSAIGPFGVMDALGIFAYSGLFPPEPSAWTKQYLGWDSEPEVVELESGVSRITLRNTSRRAANDAARIPISPSEYYLVENRARDVEGDGVRMRVWTHEGEKEVVFENGAPEFNDQTVSGFPGGVVVDVDDFDFALPGGLDENGNPLLGGVLIWHVDENRLRATLSDNRVNADRNGRAIDLEEADGAQDIGYSSTAGFFGPRFDLGSPFDFWYEGNPVTVRTNTGRDIRLYENRFGPDTYPSSENNAGARTGLNLSDFSVPGPTMSFSVSRIPDGPYDPIPLEEWQLSGNLGESGEILTTPYSELIWTWSEGTWSLAGSTCYGSSADIRPAIINERLMVVTDQGLEMVQADDCSVSTVHTFGTTGREWTTPSVEWVWDFMFVTLYAGYRDAEGAALMILKLHEDGRVEESSLRLSAPVTRIFVDNRDRGGVLLVTEEGVLNTQGVVLASAEMPSLSTAAVRGDGSLWTLAWGSRQHPGSIFLLSSDDEHQRISIGDACIPNHATWRHLDGDNVPELLFTCGSRLYAVHETGAFLAGFPIELSGEVRARPFLTQDTTGRNMVLVSVSSGFIDGFKQSGESWQPLTGFPLSAAAVLDAVPLVRDESLMILSKPNQLSRWRFEPVRFIGRDDPALFTMWTPGSISPPEEDGLLISGETYNWPNPITEGQTRIRFATSEPSEIRIDIVDLNGLLIDRIDTSAPGSGLPTEAVWSTGAGSGVYLARIRATSSVSNRTATRLIRMAIVR